MNNLYLVNLSDGKEALLTPHDGPGSFFGGKFAPDGVRFTLLNKDRDLIAFARVKIDEADNLALSRCLPQEMTPNCQAA